MPARTERDPPTTTASKRVAKGPPRNEVDKGNNVFYIDDPSGDLYDLLTASANAMLTVFDNHDTGINEEAVHTAGTWGEEDINTSDGVTTFTTFTTSSAFPAHAIGWTLQPNANKPIFFPIVDITNSNTVIWVAGDLTGVAQAGDQYFILHPPGIDKTNGAVNTNATEQTTRFLAFGYQFITPMVGVDTGSGIEGRQGGNNLAGQYQVWNRNYLPDIGRWTTTDPAMSPWSNLLDYVNTGPLVSSDPTGLSGAGGYLDSPVGPADWWDVHVVPTMRLNLDMEWAERERSDATHCDDVDLSENALIDAKKEDIYDNLIKAVVIIRTKKQARDLRTAIDSRIFDNKNMKCKDCLDAIPGKANAADIYCAAEHPAGGNARKLCRSEIEKNAEAICKALYPNICK